MASELGHFLAKIQGTHCFHPWTRGTLKVCCCVGTTRASYSCLSRTLVYNPHALLYTSFVALCIAMLLCFSIHDPLSGSRINGLEKYIAS